MSDKPTRDQVAVGQKFFNPATGGWAIKGDTFDTLTTGPQTILASDPAPVGSGQGSLGALVNEQTNDYIQNIQDQLTKAEHPFTGNATLAEQLRKQLADAKKATIGHDYHTSTGGGNPSVPISTAEPNYPTPPPPPPPPAPLPAPGTSTISKSLEGKLRKPGTPNVGFGINLEKNPMPKPAPNPMGGLKPNPNPMGGGNIKAPPSLANSLANSLSKPKKTPKPF